MKVSNKKRLFAQIIDVCVMLIAGHLIFSFWPALNAKLSFFSNFNLILLYAQFCGFIYFFLMYLFFQTTLGRLIEGHRILSKDGKRMNFFQLLIRSMMQCLFAILIINIFYQFIFKDKSSLFAKATLTEADSINNKNE